jgi:hypothetical protein
MRFELECKQLNLITTKGSFITLPLLIIICFTALYLSLLIGFQGVGLISKGLILNIFPISSTFPAIFTKNPHEARFVTFPNGSALLSQIFVAV